MTPEEITAIKSRWELLKFHVIPEATARDIPALIDEIERLQAELVYVRDLLRRMLPVLPVHSPDFAPKVWDEFHAGINEAEEQVRQYLKEHR